MTAFTEALDVIYDDDNEAVDAVYFAGGKGDGVDIRAIFGNPSREQGFGTTGAVVNAFVAYVRASEVASPVKGDEIEIAAVRYVVQTSIARNKRLEFLLELSLKR